MSVNNPIVVPLEVSGSQPSSYNSLANKPSINGVTLQGDKSAEELGLGNPFESGTGTDSAVQINKTEPNTASGGYSTALGWGTTASGDEALAIGLRSTASGVGSFAGGVKSGQADYGTTASGAESLAFGISAKAEGQASVALGQRTVASGNMSIAVGNGSQAIANSSMAVGQQTQASALMSAAIGNYVQATGRASMVVGQYNVPDDNDVDTSHGGGARKYLFIVGNGTADNARSNAMTVDWDGNEVLAGKLTLGADPTNDMDAATMGFVAGRTGNPLDLATTNKEDLVAAINELVSRIETLEAIVH